MIMNYDSRYHQTIPLLSEAKSTTIPRIELNMARGQTKVLKLPRFDGEHIYYCTYEGKLKSVREQNGNLNWEYGFENKFNLNMTPKPGFILFNDLYLLVSHTEQVIVMDKENGEYLYTITQSGDLVLEQACLVENDLFIEHIDEVNEEFVRELICFNLDEQKIRWKIKFNGTCMYLTSAENFIITYDLQGSIYAFSKVTGNLVWEKDFAELGTYSDMFGKTFEGEVASAPILKNGTLIVPITAKWLVGLDIKTGDTLWQTKIKISKPRWSLMDSGTNEIEISGDSYYYRIDAASGQITFEQDMEDEFDDHKVLPFTNPTGNEHFFLVGNYLQGTLFLIDRHELEICAVEDELLKGFGAGNPPLLINNRIYTLGLNGDLNVFDII